MALPKIHTSNLIYIAICAASIAVFFFVGILPNMKAMKQIEEDIAALNNEVRTQEVLYPIYRELIKEIQQPIPEELPHPEPQGISQRDISQINAVFQQIAQDSGVQFDAAAPDSDSYLSEGGHLIMNVRFRGDFFVVRDLLFEVSRLPYLASVSYMSMLSRENEKVVTLQLKLLQ